SRKAHRLAAFRIELTSSMARIAGPPSIPTMTDASKTAPEHGISRSDVRSAGWVWLVAAIAGAWFLTLGTRHLLQFDEGRYAEIAREMFVTGDWVTIRYNGLKYFEK